MPRLFIRGVPSIPITPAPAPPDPTPSGLLLSRNPRRMHVILADYNASYLAGAPFTAFDVASNGLGLTVPLVAEGQPLVLPGYTGELHAISIVAASQLNVMELVDDVDRSPNETLPMRFRVRQWTTPATGKGRTLPVQGSGIAPVRVLEQDPDGLRRFLMLLIGTAGPTILLSTSGTPGDTRAFFQLGAAAIFGFDPLVFAWPFVPRSGLFAISADNVVSAGLIIVEGIGGQNVF